MSRTTRVVVVTGGGNGIGAAIAESIGRTGAFVVTLDPLLSLDGSKQLTCTQETTADRIVAAGGAARASAVSVTDESKISGLFSELAEEFGGLDAVVNVAGISRPTSFAEGNPADWDDVLAVHLDGYRNVLSAALPLMAAAGRGHILGVTSGSGWRLADAGAYGCAKRAVASLTWQLGRHAPDGVIINAISPIAATRMVTAALGRESSTGGNTRTGGLSLGALPAPEQLGPLGAHLVDDAFLACQGRVLFTSGSEVAVIDEPRLIEVVRTANVSAPAPLMEAATTAALVPAESQQVSGGGINARLGPDFDSLIDKLPPPAVQTCAIVSDHQSTSDALTSVLGRRGVQCRRIDEPTELADEDAVVVAKLGDRNVNDVSEGWQCIVNQHRGIAGQIAADAQWARMVAQLAVANKRRIRLVTVTDATTSAGRSRAQASAQLARAGGPATRGLVLPFAISAESHDFPAELVAHLICSDQSVGLAGAELATATGWFGIRSHPRPIGSIMLGGPDLPEWFDDILQEIVEPK